MSEQEHEFIKEFKKSMANYLAGFVITVMLAGVGFYFTTTNKISNHEIAIKDLREGKAEKEVVQLQLVTIKESLIRIEGKIDEKK